MDTMKVDLIRYTPDGEKLIASAAKLCYSPVGIGEIEENLTEEETERFLNHLMKLGHSSPLEHISFTFAVEGVSRTLTHQLVRHRLASYSQQSQRYVKVEELEYITPPSILENEEAKEIYDNLMTEISKAYTKMTELLEKDKEDLKDSQKEKASIEDARYILPNGTETKIIFTMNARSLLHFISLRTCQRAQWEIREMATRCLVLAKEIYPTLFKNAGPGCVSGPCPEGPMTCGKIEEVRATFKNL